MPAEKSGPGAPAFVGFLRSESQVQLPGRFIAVNVILASDAFVLARFSPELLLGKAANLEEVEAIRQALNNHPNVLAAVELLTMHRESEQIPVNARQAGRRTGG